MIPRYLVMPGDRAGWTGDWQSCRQCDDFNEARAVARTMLRDDSNIEWVEIADLASGKLAWVTSVAKRNGDKISFREALP